MHCKVTVESPVAFAGERFSCIITFTNDIKKNATIIKQVQQPELKKSSSLSSLKSVLSFFSTAEPEQAPIYVKQNQKESEGIAFAFAQMTGNFMVDQAFVKTSSLQVLKSRVMYSGGVGGGGVLHASSGSASRNLPVYSTAPSLLFNDLVLGPGETKAFRYELDLPSGLPSTHRGRIVRFSYKLLISVYRPSVSSKTQVYQVPFRLFSRTDDYGNRQQYEIMNPIIINRDDAIVEKWEHKEAVVPRVQLDENDDSARPSISNIILACQFARNRTFAICKNNEHVAQVTLLRETWRLGESVTGIVSFVGSSIPCYQVSFQLSQISLFLENTEVIELPYATRSKQEMIKQTKRVYAEFHKNVLNAKRANISLSLPTSASADVNTSLAVISWNLRIEFITGVREVLLDQTGPSGNFVHYSAVEIADVEAFDCVVPLKVYGTLIGDAQKEFTFEI